MSKYLVAKNDKDEEFVIVFSENLNFKTISKGLDVVSAGEVYFEPRMAGFVDAYCNSGTKKEFGKFEFRERIDQKLIREEIA